MEVKDKYIPYTRANSVFTLFLLGDLHAGTIHCVENDLKNKIREIKETKNAFVIGMGDYAEFITPNDKRFDPSQKSLADWLRPDNIGEDQTAWVVNLLKPIQPQIIGLLYGNHEDTMRTHNHENVAQNICDRLGVPNLGFSTWVRFYFNRKGSKETHLIKGCFTHGSCNGITEGAKLMALMRFIKANEADIYGYGHVHDYIPKSFSRMTVPENSNHAKIKQHVSVGTTTGCWFRTYTQGIIASYGEKKVYPPTEICCAKFTLDIGEMFWDCNRSV